MTPAPLRLDIQHYLLKSAFGGALLHPSILASLPTTLSLLESATGSAVWLQDLVGTSGLSVDRAVGFDVSSLQFPKNVTGLELVEHEVLRLLPREWVGMFAVVHQRLLILGLRNNEWDLAVANLVGALSESITVSFEARQRSNKELINLRLSDTRTRRVAAAVRSRARDFGMRRRAPRGGPCERHPAGRL